jgi:Type I phosphodiesterase / nucleotide pyrophosphatase
LLVASGGVVALVVAATGSLVTSLVTGVLVLVAALLIARERVFGEDVPDPSRRRLLASAGGAALALVAVGGALGAAVRRRARPDPRPRLEADAMDLGSEYLELVVRGYHPERSGDLQLVVTPFSSSNYEEESRSLVPHDPRSSHAVVWMYAERVPIVVWSPGRIEPQDHVERVTLADLAPTTARLMGFDGFEPADGVPLPGTGSSPLRPRVIVTLVIDGGGWNVLGRWPDAWPNLKRLMAEGSTYRNAITGSFPAVTAAAHATIGTGAFPRTHGITGHNVRRGGPVKAWGDPGRVDPSFLLVPTLADHWTEHTQNEAWVGELGYQVWHLGMLGRGGRSRGELPVGVFWHEDGGGGWKPHNPDLYRLPRSVPGIERLDSLTAAYGHPPPSPFDPTGKKAMCCFPPVVRYQGELIEATFDSEPIGEDDVTDLLYVNFKAPDYAGHVYNFEDPHQADVLGAVDQEIGLLSELLEARFGDSFVLIVAADHGQCPRIDPSGGVRIDPIQLGNDLRREFGTTVFRLVQNVAPSEVYLDRTALFDAGVTAEDVAAFLSQYRYGENIGPYIARAAVRRDRLDARTFAAVLPTSFISDLASKDLTPFGDSSYPDADPFGLPPVTW